ncbi:MerR family DNA-binding transcriptional regulator [Nonomuraea sp. NPDC046570]|uniref:MerR family DNA-binding transcriptional regulator n=1 Tax=Nonomuraea sp. NPDC046570 TaxID=3155255 RepID=UPI0033FA91C4
MRAAPQASAVELAGVSVRTLHHYDEIRLVRPSARTVARSAARIGVACTESGMAMIASRNITDRFPAVRRFQVVTALCARHTSAWNREVVHRGVQGPSVQMYQGPLKCSYQTSSGPGTRSGM